MALKYFSKQGYVTVRGAVNVLFSAGHYEEAGLIDIVDSVKHISFSSASRTLGRIEQSSTILRLCRNLSQTLNFIPLEILLADNNILTFQGFNKWRPDSLCYSFPALRAVRNNKV